MRTPAYLSPSSLKTFEASQKEYYLRYQADTRPPKLPQTAPMAVGSAFDAYIKSYLQKCLFGKDADPAFEFETLFEKQVEAHARDQARIDGGCVFDCYRRCGAIADLMLELNKAVNKPRFEFDLQGFIHAPIGPVPVLGKPDIFFINDQGARVILDWKVNGFYSKSTTSPAKGYIMVRDGWEAGVKKPSGNNRMPHGFPTEYKGIKIGEFLMEEVNSEWADQLLIYSWLLGEEPGSMDLILGIDQIVGPSPTLRVASHRTRSAPTYQYSLVERLDSAWQQITSCSYLSQTEREHLDLMAQNLSDGSDLAEFVNLTSR